MKKEKPKQIEKPKTNVKPAHSDGDGANLLFMTSFDKIKARKKS